MTFFEKFKILCAEKEVSQEGACKGAGLSKTAWIRWSYGSYPRAESLQKICRYFGVTPESMIDDEQEPVIAPDDETTARQKLMEQTEMRVLFDAAQGVPSYKLYEVAAMLMKWKEDNNVS